jgi:HK97 family phage portal protein
VAFWRNVVGYFTGASYRQKGQQSGEPAFRNESPAVAVSTDTALQLSTVWSCVRLITETIGTMPIKFYKVDESTGIRTALTDHPLAVLFANKVNRWQTRQEFLESLIYQFVLHGNAYAAIQRGVGGKIIGLIPLMSEQMRVTLTDDGRRIYEYYEGQEIKVYAEESIWHIKLFGNGVVGLSPISYAKNSIGIGSAAENSVSKIYRNGGKPSGILMIDKVLTKDQREKIKENFSELAEGNADRLFVLEAGLKFEQISMSPQDIELLASRRYQTRDIARFFGVPSILINDESGTALGSGIGQILQAFYKLGLRPYLERMEASMKIWLLSAEERQTIDIEFDFNSLLRPDQADRIKIYKEAVQGGIMTCNEARACEGWKPLEGGDSLLVQQQMIALEDLEDLQRGQSTDGKEDQT